MTMETATAEDDVALETLDRGQCIRLLGTQIIGRIAVADFNAPPLVVPVNFVLDRDTVVFRCAYGTKFRLAVLGEKPVSFEVDGLDPGRRTGWSVLVQGDAVELDGGASDVADPRPWAGGARHHWVRIIPSSISGRRITFRNDLPLNRAGYL